jgi:hypothetical protein
MSHRIEQSGFGSCFLSKTLGVLTTAGCFGSWLASTCFGIRRRSEIAAVGGRDVDGCEGVRVMCWGRGGVPLESSKG